MLSAYILSIKSTRNFTKASLSSINESFYPTDQQFCFEEKIFMLFIYNHLYLEFP